MEKPIVLAISGHDPSGAAGLQADIESITQNKCQCVSIITSLTAQNTQEFKHLYAQESEHFHNQTELLMQDIKVQACKIGLIGNAELIDQIETILIKLKGIPVVLDPVLASGTGTVTADKLLREKLLNQLLPLATLITPNYEEACSLAGTDEVNVAAEIMFEYGCKNILITGGDRDTQKVINRLYFPDQAPVLYEWEKLEFSYHGSGCTLSASIAALLAQGKSIQVAVEEGQEFTWQTLKHATAIGKGQRHPNRFYK